MTDYSLATAFKRTKSLFQIFDPNLTKKKKKKTGFNLDAALAESTGTPAEPVPAQENGEITKETTPEMDGKFWLHAYFRPAVNYCIQSYPRKILFQASLSNCCNE